MEKHQCVVSSHVPPTRVLACNPGMCPDWESNQQPFGSQARTQSTEPHQPGLFPHVLTYHCKDIQRPFETAIIIPILEMRKLSLGQRGLT